MPLSFSLKKWHCFTFLSHLLWWILSEGTDYEVPFTYTEGTGKGPKEWGQIDPHWKACGNGKTQSPIDLLGKRAQVFPTLGIL